MNQQLRLDLGVTNIDDAMTDRQTDRQTDRPAADAGRENRQGKESIEACGRDEPHILRSSVDRNIQRRERFRCNAASCGVLP